jgi:AraC family transcriptional regulator of adaptative response/methylated-DNA-[protein]-cysteine methyltransferase
METTTGHLPRRAEMLRAFMERDSRYEGLFFTAVRTTGIFCRPTCTARKPRAENVEFFGSTSDALLAGYRPCRRCEPMRAVGGAPAWLRPLVERVEREPMRRWRDREIRRLGLDPGRVRRWFQRHHGMTFHAYSRARRLGEALGRIQQGDSVSGAAFGSGYDSLSGFNEAFRKLAGAAPTEAADAPLVSVTRIRTPLGPMIAGATDEAVCLLEFADRRMLPTQLRVLTRRMRCVLAPGTNGLLDVLAATLEQYFRGEEIDEDVPLALPGTPFQERVWRELLRIPRGSTISYAELARRVGRPSAVRAVAAANGANRVAILVPCHRVVGSDGSLTGYGGGVWRKHRLLELEGAIRGVDGELTAS